MARKNTARKTRAQRAAEANVAAAHAAAQAEIPGMTEEMEQEINGASMQIEGVAPVETELTPNRSVVPTRWVKAYAKSQLKGTCGDQIAYQLDEITKTDGKADLAKIRALGAANSIDVDLRWGARNVGMKRMNLGNVLRGRIKRGEPVHLA
ncbi:MAG: hypothetical protein EHM33_00450 [Chloroflexi bacterium]|nr:MAG: hypothetical protein EHM33_00450 [Chloroflexota bacterium]